MNRHDVWLTLKENILEVLPNFSSLTMTETDSLKELGANSIDRAEIIMLTMSQLKLKIPLVTFATAKNIGELLDIFSGDFQPIS
ncbi:MAG: acyl carrier protein [Gammaproteobacteria bacterium]